MIQRIKEILLTTLLTVSSIILLFIFASIFDRICNGDVLELNEASVGYINYFPGGVDPLITENSNLPNRTIGSNLELNINSNILKYLYWNNKVHAGTDKVLNTNGSVSSGQFRTVGLEFHLGVIISDNLQFGYYHHSIHTLDTTYGGGTFPRLDGIELKLFLYKANKSPEGIF